MTKRQKISDATAISAYQAMVLTLKLFLLDFSFLTGIAKRGHLGWRDLAFSVLFLFIYDMLHTT